MKKFRFKWIYFVSRRISKVDRSGRTAVTSNLASVGVCFGVMGLIVVMSVMNGFQRSFIDSIMEISSYHLRAGNLESQSQIEEFSDYCKKSKAVECAYPFCESQSLITGPRGNYTASMIREIDYEASLDDKNFIKELKLYSGRYDLSQENFIVVGSGLATALRLKVGSEVTLFSLSTSTDEGLLSNSKEYIVKGIFHCGYSDINSSYAFIPLSNEKKQNPSSLVFGVKLKNSSSDSYFASQVKNTFSNISCLSWREYNRSFFGALRMEKNVLFLLVFLIFVVVFINIYNGMKKLIYERREDIATLSALGGTKKEINFLFSFQGFMTGFKGSLPGLILSIIICRNMKSIFIFLSKAQYFIQYALYSIFSPDNVFYLSENPMYEVYASIPARMDLKEVVFIFLFGIFSAFFAAFLASRDVLKLTISEVLRNE